MSNPPKYPFIVEWRTKPHGGWIEAQIHKWNDLTGAVAYGWGTFAALSHPDQKHGYVEVRVFDLVADATVLCAVRCER